jgi:hypothetical protein
MKEQQLASEADLLEQQANKMIVATQDDVAAATNLLSIIKTSEKALEEQRTFLVKPLNDHVKTINNRFKLYSQPLERATTVLKNKILHFNREMQRLREEELAKRRKAEAEERARQEAEARRIREEAEAAAAAEALATGKPYEAPVIETPQFVAPPAPPPAPSYQVQKTVRADLGTATAKKKWTYEIEDENLIPREYMTADLKKIGAVVKAGIRNIPGVRIFEEDTLQVRSR